MPKTARRKVAKKSPAKPAPRSKRAAPQARSRATQGKPAPRKLPPKPAKATPKPTKANPAQATPVPTRPRRPAVMVEKKPNKPTAARAPGPAAPPSTEAKPVVPLPADQIPPMGTPAPAMDLATAIQKSRMFFGMHGLGALAGAIPDTSAFPEGAREGLAQAAALGLSEVFVFPPVAAQRASLEHLIHQLAKRASETLAGEHQYADAWIYQPERLGEFAVRGRPEGAYLLCLGSAPVPRETTGTDAGRLRDWLDERSCSSLTLCEYLVLQRLRAERHADHRFDANGGESPQVLWLLDETLGDGADAKLLTSSWNPKMRRVEIGWCGPRDANARKGTYPTRVIAAANVVP